MACELLWAGSSRTWTGFLVGMYVFSARRTGAATHQKKKSVFVNLKLYTHIDPVYLAADGKEATDISAVLNSS